MTEIDVSAMNDDSWETCVSAGIALAQDMDANRWGLGDIGMKVQSRYGQDSMGRFSAEIGIANAQTFRDYTRVARRYQPATRNAFSGSTLTFTHFRSAMRAGDDAELWLARAADETWSAKELGRQIAAAIGKPVGPRLLWSGEAVALWNPNGGITISIPPGSAFPPAPTDFSDATAPGMQRITVKVYKVQGAE